MSHARWAGLADVVDPGRLVPRRVLPSQRARRHGVRSDGGVRGHRRRDRPAVRDVLLLLRGLHDPGRHADRLRRDRARRARRRGGGAAARAARAGARHGPRPRQRPHVAGLPRFLLPLLGDGQSLPVGGAVPARRLRAAHDARGRRRRRHVDRAADVALSVALLGVWAVFLGTLGAVPSWLVAALFFGIGVFGGAFVLTWPIGREVNPPELAGIAVAVVNLGGFQGAALTQGPIGAVLGLRPGGHPPEPPAARDARPDRKS